MFPPPTLASGGTRPGPAQLITRISSRTPETRVIQRMPDGPDAAPTNWAIEPGRAVQYQPDLAELVQQVQAELDMEVLVEKVQRKLRERFAVERERRGWIQWP